MKGPASPSPRCPFCSQVLDPDRDILWANAGGSFRGTAFMYCGRCGAVLGGAPDAKTLTKKD